MVWPKKELNIKHMIQTGGTFSPVIHTASHQHKNTRAQPYLRTYTTLRPVLQDDREHSVASYCIML
jgi:hypothetical protein